MNRVSAHGPPPIDRLQIDCLQIDRLQIDHLQVLLQSRSIIACYKCISKLTRSRPPSASLSSLNLDLQVHLQTRSITASECTSFSGAPRIALNHRLLPVQIYCV